MSNNKYVIMLDSWLEKIIGKDISIDIVIVIVAIILMILSATFIMFCYIKLHEWWWLHKPTKKKKKRRY